MLQSLRIRNLALLEEVSLDFEAGFTAVTGETGAGKSILLGALSLLAGERADKAVIRHGAPSCDVEASLYFADSSRIDAALAELDLPPSEDGVVLLKRSLPREKAPRISVNGEMATLSALQRLGERWVDFHGPSEPRRLLKESCQLELLDLYGKHTAELDAYREKHRQWRQLVSERQRIASEERLGTDQIEFLKVQLGKFDQVDLTPDAIGKLERDHQRLSKAGDIASCAQALCDGLTGEEGIQGRMAALLREAKRLESLVPSEKAQADRLAAASVELADLAAEFGALAQASQFEPEEAEALAERMNAWLEIKRKYGPEPAAVAAAGERLKLKLQAQEDLEGTMARLDSKIAEAQRSMNGAASLLRAAREKAAKSLSKVAAKAISELGFARAEFRIRIAPLDEPGPDGDCACQFEFSPNVGEPPQPLNRIASSGELARVMLALKTTLADLDAVPLLVFDEVDANVGGEIGRIVGEKMARIGSNHQVLCVTHLPQVAAQAACHLVVTKDQSGDRASVAIAPIQQSRKARVAELARMLGDREARSALAHAQELLS